MSRIVVLQACRHGIGCSHLVANIAVMLVQRGYRVGLLDTDSRSGGLRTLFGLDEFLVEEDLDTYWWLSLQANATKVLASEVQRYDTPLESSSAGIYLPLMVGQFASGADYLTSLQKRYEHTDVRQALGKLCQHRKLDYLLIDNQPDLTDDNLMGLSIADVAMVMMQLDTYDFQRTAVILDVLERLSTAKVCMIPTLVLPEVDASGIKRKIELTYQHPVIGILHLTEAMIRLASSGVFCLHYPAHELTMAITGITQQLEDLFQTTTTNTDKTNRKGNLGRSRKRPLLNLLDFPNLERRLLTRVLRQGPVEVAILLEQSDYSSEEVMQAIEQLTQQGWLTVDPDTNRVRYCTIEPARSDRDAG
ncbi:MAG: P-loop NTPase [Cyanobacteria bacterium J06638_28]